MRLLLDTHTLLWFALTDPQLSGTATSLIMDPDNEKLVSPASYWEIAIKIRSKYVFILISTWGRSGLLSVRISRLSTK